MQLPEFIVRMILDFKGTYENGVYSQFKYAMDEAFRRRHSLPHKCHCYWPWCKRWWYEELYDIVPPNIEEGRRSKYYY